MFGDDWSIILSGGLGIGALYFSPFFSGPCGSTHGYDVVDPSQIDESLGSEEQFGELAETLREAGLGLMIDIVPNHMGIDDPHNAWWQDVLENGPASTFAKYFDIDWNPPKAALQGKVLLPTLGDQFGKVLEEQQLQLAYDDERFVLRYYQRTFPTDPRTWAAILSRVVEFVADRLDTDAPERMELESIVTAVEHLPLERARPKAPRSHCSNDIAKLKSPGGDWRGAAGKQPAEVRRGVEQTRSSTTTGDAPAIRPVSLDRLEAFVTDQPYRLCHWRVATDEINYRRFFDVDSLAAIRVEDPEVFQAVHEATFRLVERGWGDCRLYRSCRRPARSGPISGESGRRRAAGSNSGGADPTAHAGRRGPALYDRRKDSGVGRVAAGRLACARDDGLRLPQPAQWRLRRSARRVCLRDTYVRFIGNSTPLADVLHDSKRTILASSLSAELYQRHCRNLPFDRISLEQHRLSRRLYPAFSCFAHRSEVVACFPVYRTYIRPEEGLVRDEDRRRILDAVRVAKRRNPAMSPSFFDFIRSVMLLLENPARPFRGKRMR